MMSTTICVAAAENDLVSPEILNVVPDTAAAADAKRPKRRTLRGWMSSSLVSRMPSLKPVKSIITNDHTSDYSIQVPRHLKNQDREDGKSSNSSGHEEAPAEDDAAHTSCLEGASVSSGKDIDLQAGLEQESNLGEILSKAQTGQSKERVNGCLHGNEGDDEYATSTSVLNFSMSESIPEYSKSDLMIRKHLGKGSFSDVFEVVASVAVEETSLDSLGKNDLDRLIEAKFAAFSDEKPKAAKNAPEDQSETTFQPSFKGLVKDCTSKDTPKTGEVQTATRPYSHNRRQTIDNVARTTLQHGVAASLCVRNINQPVQARQVTYAMKCLRPQIRSDKDKFAVGIKDLLRETVILAALDHPNIIKIHGRGSGGRVSASSRLSDGYFILLDPLVDTLEDRLVRWGKNHDAKISPSFIQIKTAWTIADALAYLHSKNIVFRDLKPANVGFDSMGALKLFDFGFAACLNGGKQSKYASQAKDIVGPGESNLLYGRCGTMRYMAPEVGLASSYGAPADVYSFGVLLWEVCALKKPFAHIKSESGFYMSVFDKGVRPKLSKRWPKELTDTMSKCWSSFQDERPGMEFVKMSLGKNMRESGPYSRLEGKRTSVLRRSSVFGRLSLP